MDGTALLAGKDRQAPGPWRGSDRALSTTPAILAPLLPVAVAVTAGIILDRYVGWGVVLAILCVPAAGLAWLVLWSYRLTRWSVVCLWISAGLLGAAWHHVRHQPYANDIRFFAGDDGSLVKLRGVVRADPIIETIPAEAPLRSRKGYEQTKTVLKVTSFYSDERWQEADGQARLFVEGRLSGIRVGDEVELVGRCYPLQEPGNPGEFDYRAAEEDRGISAHLHVDTADVVVTRREADFWSVDGWLAKLRSWGVRRLQNNINPPYGNVAAALLLGDQTALTNDELEGYQRTGVFHVLAISGQHLVILCAALWFVMRLLGLSRWGTAWAMTAFVVAYALLTGNQPPVFRAAAVVVTICGAIILRRRVQLVNSLALAWLLVALKNPSDLFQAGCQLSFLSVLVLYLVVRPLYQWWSARGDNLTRLIEETRPHWQQLLRTAGSWLCWSLITSLVIWLASAPLLAARYHLVSPVAVMLSPLMILLTSVALIGGFLFLLVAPLGDVVSRPFAWVVEISLRGCEHLVDWGERIPAGYWYSSGLPEWWLWVFYIGLSCVLLWPLLRRWWLPFALAGVGWLCLGLAVQSWRPAGNELRCTFLSVGHGSCAVIETPDGRVLLYDAGSLAGPEVTQRQIAPFLWSRGITRIDEVFLSHADLDHFNGLPALLDRFQVGQVSLTPSFANKREPGAQRVYDLLAERGVRRRILSKGEMLRAGDVQIEVLHPPPEGPEGKENARSLVLLVTYGERRLLLTGDLEEPGLSQVLQKPLPKTDVMMAPHHGSFTSNTARFAAWADAELVVSSEGRPLGRRVDPYAPRGGTLWRTLKEGAVTVRSDGTSITATTFRTRGRWTGQAAAVQNRQ